MTQQETHMAALSGHERVLRAAEWGVVALHVVLTVLVLRRHEPWFDEAQAWLLSRDSDLKTLLFQHMRYEGAPPLWHLLLMMFTKTGAPYSTIGIIPIVSSAIAAALIVKKAPLPLLVRAALPFTFFLFYQYAVVARSYCLVGPLLFGAAFIHRRKVEQIYLYTGLLALVAYVSVHAMLISAGLMAVHLWDLRREWARLSGESRRRQVIAMGAFAALMLGLVAMLWPPFSTHLLVDGPALDTEDLRLLSQTFTDSPFVAAVVAALSLAWFWRTGVLREFSVPFILVLMFSGLIYFNSWHQGLVFELWLFALWLSFASSGREAMTSPPDTWLRRAMLACVVLVIAIQVRWSFLTARYDWTSAYSGSLEVAEYLRREGLENKKISATGFSPAAVLPYFSRSRFENFKAEPRTFWSWQKQDFPEQDLARLIQDQPDVIIVGVKMVDGAALGLPGMPMGIPNAVVPGYEQVLHAHGALFWHDYILESDEYFVFRRR